MTAAGSEPEPGDEGETTSRIVRGVRGGDVARFGALYERVAPALHAWCLLRIPVALRARLGAEDLVQEVWFRAFRRLPGFDAARGRFRPWIFGIARHVLLHALRALRAGPAAPARDPPLSPDEIPADVSSISRRLSRDEDLARLVAAIEVLPEEDRRLFLHHGLEGGHLAEVARTLDISGEAAKKRWQRLRARLARMPALGAVLDIDLPAEGAP